MKIVILGMGRSGKAAKALLEREGHELICLDQPDGVLPENIDQIVVSPGVPGTHPLLQNAKVEVIGEMELGLRRLKQRAIGVTGTNGKTTTTLFITHALRCSGKKARALGNIGTPLCEYLLLPDEEEIIVLEMSSFQLETCSTRCLERGIILNITPDHLDRYEGFEAYAKAKCRMGEICKELYLGEGVKKIFETYSPTRDTQNYSEIDFCSDFGVNAHFAKKSFVPPAHRFELLRNLREVAFVNDSKATNVEAVCYALEKVDAPVLLLLGGRDKGANFAELMNYAKKVRIIFAFGEASAKIEMELGSKCKSFATLEEAFAAAAAEAKSGEMVLLSPACSSFDAFENYEKRGERFKQMVEELA